MAKRHRSPSYPAITLTDALERAREFYEKEGKHPTPVSVAVTHWGYSAKSSGGAAVVAALKSYGLAEDEGSGASRTIRLSSRGLGIIQDTRDDSADRNRLLHEAALTPRIIRELHDEFPDASVSEGNLNFYLVQREYNPNAVSDIIKAYRDALSYLGEHDDDADGEDESATQSKDAHQTQHSSGTTAKPLAKAVGMKQDTFTLNEGDVVLQWPVAMSEESYNDLKDWLALMERKISRSIRAEADGSEEGQG